MIDYLYIKHLSEYDLVGCPERCPERFSNRIFLTRRFFEESGKISGADPVIKAHKFGSHKIFSPHFFLFLIFPELFSQPKHHEHTERNAGKHAFFLGEHNIDLSIGHTVPSGRGSLDWSLQSGQRTPRLLATRLLL